MVFALTHPSSAASRAKVIFGHSTHTTLCCYATVPIFVLIMGDEYSWADCVLCVRHDTDVSDEHLGRKSKDKGVSVCCL